MPTPRGSRPFYGARMKSVMLTAVGTTPASRMVPRTVAAGVPSVIVTSVPPSGDATIVTRAVKFAAVTPSPEMFNSS